MSAFDSRASTSIPASPPLRVPPPAPPPAVRPVRVVRTGQALVASASLRAPERSTDPDGSGGGTRQWQRECWDYYDAPVGPAHYSGRFVGACLSRVNLTVALPDDEDKPQPVFDEEGKATHPDALNALAVLRQLKSPRGGQSQIMRTFGLNLFVAGECFLVGQNGAAAITGPAAERQWEVLSIDELRVGPFPAAGRPSYQRVAAPGAAGKDLPPDSVVLRVWQSHPRYAFLADSSLKAVRDVLEEVLLLTREIRGQILSRLAAAGVFVVPSEIEYPQDPDDIEEGEDTLTRDLIRVMSTATSDLSSAAAVVPFILRAAYEYCDDHHLRHIKFERPLDDKASDKRTDAVLRYAQGIDLPVEVTTGHAGTTYSNAWQIDESLYKAHIEPLAEIVADALTQGILRTALPGTPLVVWFDPGDLVAHPDRTGTAKDAHAAMAISDSSYRGVLGFTDADAPDEEEIARRIEIAQAMKGGTVFGLPSANGQNGQRPPAPGAGPATTGDQPVPDNVAASAVPAVWQVAAVAEFVAVRAIDHAGARLRSKANGGQMAALLKNVPNRDVARTLGPTAVRELVGGGDDALLRGQFDTFRAWAAPMVGAERAEAFAALAEREARDALYSRGG